jgi:hypothetical protein
LDRGALKGGKKVRTKNSADVSRAKSGVMIVFLSFLFIASLWLIDISVSSMLSGSDLVGLMGIKDPTVTYHIGLVLATFSCFMIAGLAVIRTIR